MAASELWAHTRQEGGGGAVKQRKVSHIWNTELAWGGLAKILSLAIHGCWMLDALGLDKV